MLRRAVLTLVLMALVPAAARADWQIKPFVGVKFGGDTTYLVDFDHVAGNAKLTWGVTGAYFGEVFGIEADLAVVPGYFTGGHLVGTSSLATATGNVVVALPRRWTKYTLRPYFAGGGGVMGVHVSHFALPLTRTLGAFDVGGGATGFFNERIGITWDVRYFRSAGGRDQHAGLSLGAEEVSFWRAVVALTIRP